MTLTAYNDISTAVLEYVVLAQYPVVQSDFTMNTTAPTEAFERKCCLAPYTKCPKFVAIF